VRPILNGFYKFVVTFLKYLGRKTIWKLIRKKKRKNSNKDETHTS
jgi:hypothetical protein